MSRFLLASFLFASTLPAAAGVSVGHPVPTVLAAANGLTFSEATLSVSRVDVATCSGQSDALIASQTADPVEGDDLDLPEGSHCEMVLVLDGTLSIVGSGPGGTFELLLDVDALDVDLPQTPTVISSSSGWTLRVGQADWTSASELGLSGGNHVVVDTSHPLHDSLVQRLQASTSLE